MDRTVYEVAPFGKEWQLRREGSSEAKQVFATRDEAIAKGREICSTNRPSRLSVRKVASGN